MVSLGTAHQRGETLILGAVEAEKGILLLQVITEHLEMRMILLSFVSGVTASLMPCSSGRDRRFAGPHSLHPLSHQRVQPGEKLQQKSPRSPLHP